MSVLIKDMELPETCDDCPFHVYHSHYEYVCKATPMLYPMNLANTKGIRKEWCPLIEQAIEPEQRWIPCSERLPEDYTEVFVYLLDSPSPYIAWIEDTYWYTEDFEVAREDEPVAWMPLPEKYREEGAK